MRLAPSAFGGGSPNALLAPLKREVVSLRPVYIVRNFYHLLYLLSDDMGAVFINTILHHAQKDMRGAVFGLLGRKMQKDSV